MHYFDRSFVINLPFKQDRLAKFRAALPKSFGDTSVWPAVHGDSVQHPDWWTAGRGAWGCYRSHLQILEHCYQTGVESYIVFEDDAIFRPNTDTLLQSFLAELPADWEQVYLGGQLLHEIQHPPRRVSDNVFIPYNVNRTHCYAVHRRGYAQLYKHLNAAPFHNGEHIDHHVGRLHESGQLKIYCPGQWLVGQDGGPSNISGKTNSPTFWVDPAKLGRSDWLSEPTTCVFLESSMEVAVELQRRGWHRGHWQNAEGLDRGVCDAVASNNSRDSLMKWYRAVVPEAVREGHQCVCLYHPHLSWECVKSLPIPDFLHVSVNAQLNDDQDLRVWNNRVQTAADEAEGILARYQALKTFVGNEALSPTKNLIYHLWPKAGNGIWQWNVEQLLSRIEMFDGVRTIGIVTDSDSDTVDAVQAAFAGVRIDNWITFPNNPALGEVVTFEKMLESLPRGDNTVTFYGHAKGVRHGGEYNTKRWAEAMYEVCLDDEAFIDSALRSHPITGPFKRRDGAGHWHYSGAFFWFRNAEVFSKNWRDIEGQRFGVEFWPRRLFAEEEGGSLFGHEAGTLYHDSEWESHIQPWLDDWRSGKSSRNRFVWKPVPKPKISPTSSRLVITVATGEAYRRVLSLTQPLMEGYAKKCGADFVALTDITQTWWGHEKFRVLDYAGVYEQVLFLDSDCIIRPTCPDLFPMGPIAMHDDYHHVESHSWMHDQWKALMQSQQLDRPTLDRLLNTGVVLCDRTHADIWTPPRYPVPGEHCDEQFWIDHTISGQGYSNDVVRLDRTFNHQWWMPDFHDKTLLENAHIIHLANCPIEDRHEKAREFILTYT